MKNESTGKVHQNDAVLKKRRTKTSSKSRKTKRSRSKHKRSKKQLKNLKLRMVLVILCVSFGVLVVSFFLNIMKISFVEVGTPIEGGIYKLSHNGSSLNSNSENSEYSDKYHVTYNSNGEYSIQSVYSSLFLTALIDSNKELSFKFSSSNETCNQRFFMTIEGQDKRLISTCDIDTQSSVWHFEPIEQVNKLPDSSTQKFKNGIYAFVPDFNQQGLLESVDNLALQIVDKNNSPSQLFEITYNELGYYSIYSLELMAFLDVSNDGSLLMNNEPKEYCGQRWAIERGGDNDKIISSCNGSALGALDGINVGITDQIDEDITSWRIEERSTMLFVGDSITAGKTNCNYENGYCQTVSVNAADTEMNILNQERINYIEINMANPGATTSSYLHEMDESYLEKIRKYRIKIAQLMLGTNDSSSGTSRFSYIENISEIIGKLLEADIETVVLNYPIYNSVNPGLLLEYIQGLNGLANNETVFIGDTSGYEWFKQNSWHLDGGGKGFHPDQDGYTVLGEMWATALKSILE